MEKLKLHFGYGSRMVGAGMITTLYNNLMTILIGRYFSLSTLGLYGNANALYIVPVSVIADPINKVTFPVFVRFQNDKERLSCGLSSCDAPPIPALLSADDRAGRAG